MSNFVYIPASELKAGSTIALGSEGILYNVQEVIIDHDESVRIKVHSDFSVDRTHRDGFFLETIPFDTLIHCDPKLSES